MKSEQLARLPEILYRIGKVLGSDDSLASTLGTISQLVTQLMEAEACSIMLADPDRRTLLGKAAYGLVRDDISAVSFHFGEGVAGWVAEHAEGVVLSDVTQDSRFKSLDDSPTAIRSLTCVPLLYRNQVVGVMTITSPEIGGFGSGSIELLQLIGNTIALDIENIRLRRLSVTDRLTGAFNREFLDRQLPIVLEESRSLGEPLSIAMVDVDHFKSVNDRFGHDAGDVVLAEIARQLRGATRGRDLLIRFGGEEFLLLLPQANVATATEIADRMRAQVQQRAITVGQTELHICVSAGVAEYRAPESSASLIKRADDALYAAKRKGRNRVEIAP